MIEAFSLKNIKSSKRKQILELELREIEVARQFLLAEDEKVIGNR